MAAVLTDDDKRRLQIIKENEAAHRCRARMKDGTAVFRCFLHRGHDLGLVVPAHHLAAGIQWTDNDPCSIDPIEA